jgi:hypothetical protein
MEVNIVNNHGTINVAGRDQCIGSHTAVHDQSAQAQPVPEGKPSPDQTFQSTYASFVNDRKWKLPSGATVEDTFFDAYSRANLPEHLRKSIRHWTVLVGNNDMRSLFQPEDWQAIVAHVKPLPLISNSIFCFLEPFYEV